uniref:Regulatory protein zeste n=1 Tax=Acrobeloides nanus TaxID=290746 RepID=A0A914EQJ9_9BILA
MAEMVKDKKDFLFPNSRDKNAASRQSQAWKDITDELNKEFPLYKHTQKQVETKWKNAKQNAKEKSVQAKKHANGTGGGPSLEHPNVEATSIIQGIFAENASFNGIPNGLETSMDYKSLYDEEEFNETFLHVDNFLKRSSTQLNDVGDVEVEEEESGKDVNLRVQLSKRMRRQSLVDLQRDVLEQEYKNAKRQSQLYEKLDEVLDKFNEVLSKSNEFLNLNK